MIARASVDQGLTLEGTVRTYTCDLRTVTEGDRKITCLESGLWSSTDLYCRRTSMLTFPKYDSFFSNLYSPSPLLMWYFCYIADCGPPPIIQRSTISIGNNLQGTTRMYTCDQNTVTEGKTSIECLIDGSWSSTDLYCRRTLQIPLSYLSPWIINFIQFHKHGWSFIISLFIKLWL